MATRSPSCGPSVDARIVTVPSGLTTYTKVPNDARCTAAAGIDRRVLQRPHPQPDVDELVREQLLVRVVERGAQADGAGRGVDLVVDGLEAAVGQLDGIGAIPRLHRQPLAGAHRLEHRRQLGFRHREDAPRSAASA